MPPSARGLTLVELITVIVLLAVLSAAALPRFTRIDAQAHKSSVAATAGSFRTAVILVHAAYFAKGLTGALDNLPGFGNNNVDVNTAGYPTDTAGSNTITGTATCVNVWNGIFQIAPSITTGTSTAFDYRVTRAGQTCTYTYRRSTSPTRSFTYNAANGVVTVINP
ncbi:MAG: prepilin-type N-terminal cleavage/methylation domain-containing protein [Sulfuricaulis sp.]|uniref:prepilin-type N-terminal cleavage/methylation domain-containing protein n=1 Tax=Sulfuricaulis sp. TaxID=2003553 RepID=UPI003C4E7167